MKFTKSSILEIATHCSDRNRKLVIESILHVTNKHSLKARQISERLEAKGKDKSDLVEILNAAYEIVVINLLISLEIPDSIVSVSIDESGSMDINVITSEDYFDFTEVIIDKLAFMYPDATISVLETVPEDEEEEDDTDSQYFFD